jgi:hypothetical protein
VQRQNLKGGMVSCTHCAKECAGQNQGGHVP